jgi:hypothetical protein
MSHYPLMLDISVGGYISRPDSGRLIPASA